MSKMIFIKYLPPVRAVIKTILDVKVKTSIFEISNGPNGNKFWALLIFGPISA